MNRQILAIVGTIGLGCAQGSSGPQAPAPATPQYLAPSERTIIADVEVSYEGQSIYILNNSSVAVVITSVTVYECENIGTPCTLIHLQIPVATHQRKRIAVVRPADPERAFSYKYRWTWGVGDH